MEQVARTLADNLRLPSGDQKKLLAFARATSESRSENVALLLSTLVRRQSLKATADKAAHMFLPRPRPLCAKCLLISDDPHKTSPNHREGKIYRNIETRAPCYLISTMRPYPTRIDRLPFLKTSKFIGAEKRSGEVLTGDRAAAEMIQGTAVSWSTELHR